MADKKETGRKTAGQHLDSAIEKTKEHAHKAQKFIAHHASKTGKLVAEQTHKAKEKLATMKEKEEDGKEKKTGPNPQKKKILFLVLGAVVVLALLILLWPRGGERATQAQADSIRTMLTENDVPFRAIAVEQDGYAIYYDAESAVGRFDDAILSDWGMIYGIAAAHDCKTVSIVTLLDNEPIHKQTVGCDAVRAFVRGVLTEEEFWLLVKHESLA